MSWILELPKGHPIAHAVLVLSLVAVAGLALGSLRIRGISLGIAGVLFAGILFGHFQLAINDELLKFVREFGLILFVYTIGMQVGPGFLTSLRKQGLPLNLLALSIVVIGVLVAISLAYLLGLDMATVVGLFAGATTNTPALGAAQDALHSIPNILPEREKLPSLGYAVCYPFGIIGIILAMILVRRLFRIDMATEAEAFSREHRVAHDPVRRVNLLVENENLDGLKLADIPGAEALGVVVTRIKPAKTEEVMAAAPQTVIHCGDVLLAVGTQPKLDEFRLIVGSESAVNLLKVPGQVTYRRIVVTRKDVLGQTIRELGLSELYGVSISRVTRADLEMTAVPDLELQFGDMLQVVGVEADIQKAAQVLGNSVQEMNHTNLIPVFIGIALGILLGSYPVTVGNMPAPVRLGLAGGPLLVAIILSRIGRIGGLVWYMPVNANILVRELGITLFLACVGLKAGGSFFEILFRGEGLTWMAAGAAITLVPLLVVSYVARSIMKLNYLSLCGLLAGSMTDPPALAFANTLNRSDAPSVAYATVYPLTMLLRILTAQLIVIFFC